MPPVIVAAGLALSKIGLAVAGAVGATGFFAVGASGLAAVALGAAVVVGGALVAKKAMSLNRKSLLVICSLTLCTR